MRKKEFILIVIFFILCIGAIIGLIFLRNTTEETQSVPVEIINDALAIESLNGKKKITNQKYHFSFQIPSTWTIMDHATPDYLGILDPRAMEQPKDTLTLAKGVKTEVYVKENSQSLALDQYLEMENLNTYPLTWKDIGQYPSASVNLRNLHSNMETIIQTKNQFIVFIIFISEQDRWEEYEKEYEKVIDSIQFQ